MHSLRTSALLCCLLALVALSADAPTTPTVSGPAGQAQLAQSARIASAPEQPAPSKPTDESDPSPRLQPPGPVRITRVVKATAYNAVPAQTDATPMVCAWGDRIRPGIIAISRDLEKIGLTRGKKVYIEGYGTRIVLDRMHRRKRNQIDLYMERYEDAVRFGVKELKITWYEDGPGGQES